MYDLAELRAANDHLWSAIAARLVAQGIVAPAELVRNGDLQSIWTDPALLLGQTCGYPLVTSLKGRVSLLKTPRYRAPGCDGAFYRSAVVVRANDSAACLTELRGRRCALNDPASNSGMNMLRAEIATLVKAPSPFFSEVVLTGGHEASVEAVKHRFADVAAIDCVTWAHLQHFRPDTTRNLRVLTWTAASPGLPLITSISTDSATQQALIRALHDVAEDPALEATRTILLLDGFQHLPLSAYEALIDHERRATMLGYPILI